ncbi:N-acetyl-1-D-myo-inositol-2-amino-2-deoxy-alpha-D-glucopyranoside deacetylase [Amycolatopsis rubida]|uniref:1D-myo-inositol 2-acetamido-2-deoxy-alpha-D-glucopyranoside deacetylase n=1 Tax=Amycolatopsis rubida TaxID=112413 RepID=A0A1I5J4N9_9PSEU|nr:MULTISPECIES: N-acetyl-1-D-myo-inositol-2-amino-2-deoxy-alpha-D-glucopyranoside deacetylase [Amycolatopsis]MYW93292.1 N-acetyl-1-D-myo-inositol-2-amino-2-deoxy-alpha-D-glucopyranoside deacetylase [Amycolatopsis rubida]NEC58279.1 N-acetyl-1-D-myo-inositol-2-amino-2-deoxy-alpha-D-glucopyranoside deacetylase [Amycolatopsis rubida]OAP28725.1 1D-myo-inositol 2-acetamido-2-deoxy-alpha-D-glucopyranoside deacetylase [Amycolatopsis sp. M39]SFO67341.1 N-acetyl-1-D-myo-inositol-2-amino-2-deoxy-alpha-D-
MKRKLLLVHAHPDDESIATGGVIARYAAEGAEVCVVTCTLGEEGEIVPPRLARLVAAEADQLGGYRSGEMAAAAAALGLARHDYLGGIGRWRDSGMAGTPAAEHPRAFTGGPAVEQAAQLRELIDDFAPQVVVTYDSFGGYGHPDHIRAHEITMAAAPEASSVRRVFHVVQSEAALTAGLAELRADRTSPFRVADDGELPSTPDGKITTVVDISAHRQTKLAALRAHETQLTVVDGAVSHFALTNSIAQPIPSAEYFVLAHGDAGGAETDLFGGW